MSSVKVFTAEEVAAHSSRNDVWTIIDGKVYDITKFLDEHPGGEEVLLEGAGADSTEGFEDVGHSEDARDLLKKYYVGDLKGGVPSKKATEKAAPAAAPKSSDNSTESGCTIHTMFTISVAVIAAVAFAWKHFSA